jgi:NAD(P)-dependent dehydrogenase (short-subunit alcohol dehydrogenase family)
VDRSSRELLALTQWFGTCAVSATSWSKRLRSPVETEAHGHQAYDVAKRGNQLRVQASAAGWGSRGARINSISPGIISTPMSKAEFEGGAIVEAMRRMIAASAAKRVGTSEEIAAAVALLVGPRQSSVNRFPTTQFRGSGQTSTIFACRRSGSRWDTMRPYSAVTSLRGVSQWSI